MMEHLIIDRLIKKIVTKAHFAVADPKRIHDSITSKVVLSSRRKDFPALEFRLNGVATRPRSLKFVS